MAALNIGPGDEVIVPTMTFVATANAVLFQGGTPVLCDVEPGTLLIDVARAEDAITERTRAIIAVDYAGQPADYTELRALCDRRGLALVADACHSIGGTYQGNTVGSLADLTVFSFHPVKHITTGEGGMVLTDDDEYARLMRRFRNHGIASDHRERSEQGTWFYEMVGLGYNYRLTDLQSALGLSQLRKLPGWLARRREIAERYDSALAGIDGVTPLEVSSDRRHAYHLYVVRIGSGNAVSRDAVFTEMRLKDIGVNVHYIPVHTHPYYRELFPDLQGTLPVAEAAYREILSLPMHQGLTDTDGDRVIAAIGSVVAG